MPAPKGEISLALAAASQRLGPATLRELSQASQVGYDAARYTLGNMARSGVLQVVDARHVAYRNRLVQVYVLAGAGDASPSPVLIPCEAGV